MGSRRDEIEARFGASAEQYAASPSHRSGIDLDRMVELARPVPTDELLDVATGAGHTALAFAPLVARVTATDLSQGMIDTASRLFAEAGLANARFRRIAVEDVHAFGANAFDIVTCRIAPHHFVDVDKAIERMAGVLKPGGRIVVVDSMAPDDAGVAAFLHHVESVRDPTHVRSLTESEWRALLERHGIVVDAVEVFTKRHSFEAWVARGGTAEESQAIVRDAFRSAEGIIVSQLAIERDGPVIEAFSDEKILLAGHR